MNIKFYKVGGIIRDNLLGIKSKDIDYVCIIDNYQNLSVIEGYNFMKFYLKNNGFGIFLETPLMYTIRAKFPLTHKEAGNTADFVLARKEIGYIPNTRTPILQLGSLYDDLYRRDFTVNALAEDEDGNIIDYFNGLKDLKSKILRTPNENTLQTLNDDPLRILRAIRFCITKQFCMGTDLIELIDNFDYNQKMQVVSSERIREELTRCFKYNTWETLKYLNRFNELKNYLFNYNYFFWLKPTTES